MLDDDARDRLDRLEESVRSAVGRRRQHDDPFRGLYVSDEDVDELLDGTPPNPARWTPPPLRVDTVLGRFTERFGLDDLDVAVLIIAAAPDLDDRFERLYGFLHDDVSRRRASPGLAIELSGHAAADPAARAAVSASGRLAAQRLLIVEDVDRPFLTRSLRVPDRVLDHLLGRDWPDPGLLDVARPVTGRRGDDADAIERALRADVDLIYARQASDFGATGLYATALRQADRGAPVCVDLRAVPLDRQQYLAELADREARLIDGGLVVVGFDELDRTVQLAVSRSVAPTMLVGALPFDPASSHRTPLRIDIDAPSAAEQHAGWSHALAGAAVEPPSAFRLGPGQIVGAVAAATARAKADGTTLDTHHLLDGARSQNSAGLERLARRIVPSAGWTDIVLDTSTMRLLRQLTDRVAYRTRVLDEWSQRRGGGRGEGTVALFAGASGTGKTLAAEVIAGELGLDLYVIDLATVVDKYIGETEKNLERVFTEAEGVNAVLLFDEADALFGKRSDVSDARDRYANIEVAYLLQRMESFDGLGILTTNLKTSLDESFARRLSMTLDFPDPDERLRLDLWRRLATGIPLDADVDIEFCASNFELSGGNIRNIVVAAAYLGAPNGAVSMCDIIWATKLEYQKLGRLCLEREFGPYHHITGETYGARLLRSP
ncbi:MAG: ATP-binding protein [Actinomycetota bacterium]